MTQPPFLTIPRFAVGSRVRFTSVTGRRYTATVAEFYPDGPLHGQYRIEFHAGFGSIPDALVSEGQLAPYPAPERAPASLMGASEEREPWGETSFAVADSVIFHDRASGQDHPATVVDARGAGCYYIEFMDGSGTISVIAEQISLDRGQRLYPTPEAPEAIPASELPDSKAQQLGNALIALLHLRLKDGRVDTTWGTKTPAGLARVVARLVDEARS